MAQKSPRAIPLVFAVALLALFLPTAIGVATDWLWFQEVQQAQVMLRSILARLAVFAFVLVLAFAVFFLNFDLARRSLRRLDIVRMTGNLVALDLPGDGVSWTKIGEWPERARG